MSSLCATSDGGLWIGTGKGATFLPTSGDGRKAAQNFTSADGLAKGPVTSIFEAKMGRCGLEPAWGASAARSTDQRRRSVVERQPVAVFTTFTTADGLNNNAVRRIAQDAEGAMWFAGGVTNQRDRRLVPLRWQVLCQFQFRRWIGGREVSWVIHLDQQGGLWAATSSGLFALRLPVGHDPGRTGGPGRRNHLEHRLDLGRKRVDPGWRGTGKTFAI